MKNYINYHKHSMFSNPIMIDSPAFPEDYCKRAVELGHDIVFTTEHGWGGDIFRYREACDSNKLKCLFGIEGYIVSDVESEIKDKRNYHIFIAPKTNEGRRKLNFISSNAHTKYFYYRPRFSLKELLELDGNGFIITTACIAGIVRDEDSIRDIFNPLVEHFKYNVFLEIQPHIPVAQAKHNKKILELEKLYGLKVITGLDSHYIFPEDSKKRDILISGKGIKYEEKSIEDAFILDYPSYDEILKRYRQQGVVSLQKVEESLKNTEVFLECEPIDINRVPKMPNIYLDKTSTERFQILKDLAYQRFEDVIVEDEIKEEEIPRYKRKLDDCLDVVEKTEELNTQDYFLINEKVVKRAIEKYGGVITRTGRGSGGAFYLNRVLGLTQLDSETTSIPIYPERFMSTARILENHSFPDIDLNVAQQEPFIKATKDVLGEYSCYQMVAYGTMQLGEAFRNYCRSLNLEYKKYNEVAKNIEKYKYDPKWKSIIEECEKFVNVIISVSVHPCSSLIFQGDIREEIGLIRTSDGVVCPITSDEADGWKYLKQDYLSAIVWEIISETFKEIDRPIMTLRELKNSVDDDTWRIYEKGLCCTVNQVDSDFGTSLAMRYKPRSIDEVAKLTAAIRPSFEPWRDNFLERKPYTNHNANMDELLASTDHYILFQENIMQYFEWLGVTPAKSIGLIKKISKKKIKDSDFKELEKGLKEVWIEKCGSEDGFQENWDMIQSCMAYGFNCLTGDNVLWLKVGNKWKKISVAQLYADRLKYFLLMANKDSIYDIESLKFIEEYLRPRFVYSYDEKNHLVLNEYIDVAYVGEKECVEIITKSGARISCSLEHRFPTSEGYKKTKDLSVGMFLLWGNARKRRLWVKNDEILYIRKIGIKRTYHISIKAPYHTFTLANNVITSNSPHALAYGYDSTYGAYLKSHYPVQYYTVVLNIYDSDLKRTNKLINELRYFGISISSPRFGKSTDRYTYDLEKRIIYKSIKSIRFLSKTVAQELYELRNNKYEYFVDVLHDIFEKTSANTRDIQILIRLDFFLEFGLSKQLMFVFDKFMFLKKGEASRISKDKVIDSVLLKIIRNHSRETDSNFMILDNYQILVDFEKKCKEIIRSDYSVIEKMGFQEEYMGYISFNSDKPEDRFKLAILSVMALTRKSDGKIWAREIDAISIGTSKRNKLMIWEDYFNENQIMKGDIIMIDPKKLEKKVSNGFTNWWITSYKIIEDEKVDI